VNKNTIPFDTRSPRVTSGIRIGTPAVTTRGFGTDEMDELGELVATVVCSPHDTVALDRVSRRVTEICDRFPVPGIFPPSERLCDNPELAAG
jgi:glycine hydroxymethyltransferase